MPSLVVETGNEAGASYGLAPDRDVFILGRSPRCNIVLSDLKASRQHARLEREDESLFLVDLGSHNGTIVDGKRVTERVELAAGMRVQIGETVMLLSEAAPASEGILAGRRLGGYLLLSRVGGGGMGEVYRATQLALGRAVAVKVLTQELSRDAEFIERFMTEARSAGKLTHPNVVQVHDVGEEGELFYYVMEHLGGGSVQDLVSGGRKLPVSRSIEIVLGAALALEYAEHVGIVHCDVKPDNLMLTEDGKVRLADLGIARSLAHGKIKQIGGVLGSPHYMAPEQARGLPIDHRVDLYALGATFYRLLSGRTPFTGVDSREIMEKQVYEEPKSLRELDPDLPESVVRIVERLMRKKTTQRYQNASDLVYDLEIARARADSTPSGRSHRHRTARRGRVRPLTRQRASVIGAIVALVLLIGLIVLARRLNAWDRILGAERLARRAEAAFKIGGYGHAAKLFYRAAEVEYDLLEAAELRQRAAESLARLGGWRPDDDEKEDEKRGEEKERGPEGGPGP